MHLGSIFRPEVQHPFDKAHIETAKPSPSYRFGLWCINHFHHFKYHDPYDGSHMLAMCINPLQLGGCDFRLPAFPTASHRSSLTRHFVVGISRMEVIAHKRTSSNDRRSHRYDTYNSILYVINYYYPYGYLLC